MERTTPEAQQNLTEMFDRWMGILGAMGIKNPHADEAPKSVVLQAESGETITLNAPSVTLNYPQPQREHPALCYSNAITARQEVDGVPHTLQVNSASAPHVLAAEGGRLIAPRTTARAMPELCMQGEVVGPTQLPA